jgi:hypothetical protein
MVWLKDKIALASEGPTAQRHPTCTIFRTKSNRYFSLYYLKSRTMHKKKIMGSIDQKGFSETRAIAYTLLYI